MTFRSGRHFLQLPGPTNVPDRILRATSRATIDHRGPDFASLTHRVLEGTRKIFRTEHEVFIYPASGSGGWEAAIANTLSEGATVLVFEQGFFAQGWADVARSFGVQVRTEPWDPRRGLTPEAVLDVLREDSAGEIDAVVVVHNETSSGVTTDVASIGQAMRASGHPALLFVDAVSSLAATDFRHDEWCIDVTVCGSQKGLMLPPGLSLVAVGPRAMEAHERASLPRSYWDWSRHRELNASGFFPYTPATNLLYGLEEAFAMFDEEGFENVFARHALFSRAARAAASAWGLETVPLDEGESSRAMTAVMVPEGHDADALRRTILERFDLSLGTGLGPFKGKVFRIGHLGDLNILQLLGTIAGVEMGLGLAGVPHRTGAVDAAMRVVTDGGGDA